MGPRPGADAGHVGARPRRAGAPLPPPRRRFRRRRSRGQAHPRQVAARRQRRGGVAVPYTPILATLGYVLSPDGRRVLLVHRNKRPGDAHLGKYNGLGGKVEAGEDVVACLCREVREEAGIECERLVLCGTVSWPGFGQHGEDWFGFVFRVEAWSGTPFTENAE